MRRHIFLLFAAFSLMGSAAHAEEVAEQLAIRHQCFGCHDMDEVRAGPSFDQVAQRYGKNDAVLKALFATVKIGSVGKWGTAAMPPESVPDAELKKILQWVMQQ